MTEICGALEQSLETTCAHDRLGRENAEAEAAMIVVKGFGWGKSSAFRLKKRIALSQSIAELWQQS
jgi:hypothetical protein